MIFGNTLFFGEGKRNSSITSASFVKAYNGIGSGTTVTNSTIDFGAEDANRWVICVWGHSRPTTPALFVSSATIGGVTASIARQETGTRNSESNGIAILYAKVPTGTTNQTVSITHTGNVGSFNALGVYRIVTPSPSLIVTDSVGELTPSFGVGTYTVETSQGGVVLGGGISNNGGPGTWTGLSENFAFQISTSANDFVRGASFFDADGSDRTIEINWSGRSATVIVSLE